MRDRTVIRYSSCFKRQVVADLENGRFESIEAARQHYGIGGSATVQRWLNQYGKNHLQAKVVRVQRPDEADQMRQLKRRIVELERALGQTQAQNVLHAAYLEQACESLGEDVETFKKKAGGVRSTPPRQSAARDVFAESD
jgi:transposase-like protein